MNLTNLIPGVAQAKAAVPIAVATAFALLLAHDLRVDHLRAKHLVSLQAERQGRADDRKAYTAAQLKATALAKADRLKWENFYATKAQAADTRATGLAADYRAAVLRLEAAQRAGRATVAAASGSSTASANGLGSGALVPVGSVLIPTADALICADNTGRLQAAHDWALTLNTAP